MNDLQRTPEWRAARLGKLTASRIADATARTKTGWGASRASLDFLAIVAAALFFAGILTFVSQWIWPAQ